jgi:NAD(P)-dependent dehydrogenase (short-subunit alcohol dehydrogenase family)
MRLKLEEEQVLMGASSGIGRQTALRFTKRDARVVVSARSEGELNSQVEEIPPEGFPKLSGIAEEEKITRVARRGRPPSVVYSLVARPSGSRHSAPAAGAG